MEAQLQQSIPKKTHQEVVAKMQATIDGLNSEVERIKGDLQKTTTLNDTISGLGNQLASQNDVVSSLGKTITSQGQTIEGQRTAIEALNTKLSQSTVPVLLYDQTLSRVDELQEKIRCMVDKGDYTSIQKKCDELTEAMKSMVPREDYLNLQTQFANFVPRESFEALQKTLSQYVPRDQLVASETRVHELEARLENYVPRSDYEELTARIALLAKEASALSVEVVPTVESPTPVEQPSQVDVTPNQIAPIETVQIVEPVAVNEVQSDTTEVTQLTSVAAPSELSTQEPTAPAATPVESATMNMIPAVVEQIVEPVAQMEPVPETIAAESPSEAPVTDAPVEIPAQITIESPRVETISENLPVVAIDTSAASTVTQAPETTVVVTSVQAAETSSTAEIVASAQPEAKPEIMEIQSQLSEIKGTQDSGEAAIQMKIVDSTLGFLFENTAFCAKSGLEFLQDLEQAPIESIQSHMSSGDFERWFKDALADDTSAESLKAIRESNFAGEELRAKIVAVIAPRYKS